MIAPKSSPEKEEVLCVLCGNKNSQIVYPKLPGVIKCSGCGLVYSNPRLKKEAFENFYSQAYFESNASHTMGYDNYVSDENLVKKTFTKRLNEIQKRWLPQKGRVLDVGCATGFFLSIAQKLGWVVDGVEISKYCCAYSSEKLNLKIRQGFFMDLSGFYQDYSLITMWDYIEHTLTPDKDIEKCFKLLKPGGILALTTPDFGSLPSKIFRERWIGFKEHEHLFYFEKKNLVELLQKNGFRIKQVRTAGKYISAAFFLKRLASYSRTFERLLHKASDLEFLKKLNFYCNPIDVAYIVAEKAAE